MEGEFSLPSKPISKTASKSTMKTASKAPVTMLLNPSNSRVSISDSVIHPGLDELQKSHALESHVLRALLRMENDFNVYYNIWTKEMVIQRNAADKLWHLTQHYMIFMQMDTHCKCPQNYAIESEEVIINKYHYQYQIIMNSNKVLLVAIGEMRPDHLQFRKECQKLDMNRETPFIVGDAFHKPIQFFMDLVEELFNFFHAGYLKMDCAARQMDPLELSSVEYYQKLLEPCEEFEEYMKHNLSYCRCLCVPAKCHQFATQSKTTIVSEYAKRAQKKRCAQRLNRIIKGGLPEAESHMLMSGSNFDPDLTHQMLRQEQLMSHIVLAITPSQIPRKVTGSENLD